MSSVQPGDVMLCPCCHDVDALGNYSAQIFITTPSKFNKKQRLYLECENCGVQYWGNTPKHLAATVAISSILMENEYFRDQVALRTAHIKNGTFDGDDIISPFKREPEQTQAQSPVEVNNVHTTE